MQVALLGPHARELDRYLPRSCRTWSTEEAVTPEELARRDVQLVVSFGYRHILTDAVLDVVRYNAVNIHISLLPWNRGADPNLWSWLENTPKGVTIHWMSPGVDEGAIVIQKELLISDDETLRSSYQILMEYGADLFSSVAHDLAARQAPRQAQPHGGSHHFLRHKTEHLDALHSGWNTACRDVMEYGRRRGLWIGGPA